MKVFVTRQIPAKGLALLQDAGVHVDLWEEPLPPDLATMRIRSAGCDGILSLLSDRIDAEFMDAVGPQLKVISNFAVGYNNIDVAHAQARGIAVGHTPDVLTDATADLAFALLIGAARRLSESEQLVRDGRWKTWSPLGHIGQDLVGKTLGVFGMGRIGQALAKRCVGGWGMKVVYCARSPKPVVEESLGAERVEFETLLRVSDFVSLHAPLTSETEGLFGRRAFAKMKRSAVFINTARGGLCDESALYEALTTGQLFAAGLDVTDPEPMAPSSPLLSLPNCTVLPHIGSATISSREAMALIAVENLIAGLRGEPLPHAVSQAPGR